MNRPGFLVLILVICSVISFWAVALAHRLVIASFSICEMNQGVSCLSVGGATIM